jgi:hypothetical protein
VGTAVAALLLLAPWRDVVLRFMHDDAFYYFGVAWRWSRLGFSTFDGINPTDGYHPLWQWVLVAAAGVFTSPGTFARVGGAMGVVFFVAGTWLTVRRLTRDANPFAPFAYAWVGGTLLLATIYGMESPLAALLLALGIASVPSTQAVWTPAGVLACAAATALLFLARLDALAWIVALDAVLVAAALGSDHRRMLRPIALMAALHLLVVGGYFLGNWLTWGHWLSISAALKAARAPFFSLAVPRSLLLLLAIGITGLGLVPLAELAFAVYRRRSDTVWALTTAAWLALANVAYLAAIAAKGGPETFNWYFTLTVFSGGYLLPFCMERYGALWAGIPRRLLAWSSLAVCLVLFAVSARSKLSSPSYFVGAYDKAMVLASFPEDSLVLAATDCGVLGYFSRQRVINLDGLTNSWDFLRALDEDRLGEWLSARGLNTYVAPPLPDERKVLIYTRAGLSSPAQTLSLHVEPMSGTSTPSGPIAVWRVTGIER